MSTQLSNHDKNNLDLSTKGMIYTLIINMFMFSMLLGFFEVNRFYRQIFLKRQQKRFIDIGRVPPIPPRHVFGWLVAIFRVPELEVLHMVGLDGYMLLRYHTVCLKFSLFVAATGKNCLAYPWDKPVRSRRNVANLAYTNSLIRFTLN